MNLPVKTPTGDVPDEIRSLHAHEDLLRRFFIRRLRSAPEAEDCVQEVYVRVIAAAGRQGRVENWRAYLLRMAANLLTDRFRRDAARQRQGHVPLDDCGPLVDEAPDPERTLAARERLEALQAALMELDPLCRQVFVLCRIEGMSHREIAGRLGIETASVTRHIDRARVHLVRRTADWR